MLANPPFPFPRPPSHLAARTTNHSYWAVSDPKIGPKGGSLWQQPLGHSWDCNSPRTDSPCSRPWSDPTEAVAWCVPGWANVAYGVQSRSANNNVTFVKGTGNQMSRQPGCSGFYVEGPREELDAPAEFYYDAKANELLFWPNASDALPDAVTAATMEEIIRIRGSQNTPVRDVTITGIAFTAAAKSFMSPHESTNSGADWAAPRRAAVAIEGAVNVTVDRCTFDHLGGNAVLWSNYVRNSSVRNSTFEWLGASGVLAMGTDQMGDATDGEHPHGNVIADSFFRELGVYAKHSGAYAEFVAGAVTISGCIAFNGPRAAIALNDGMGGGTRIFHNLLFNMVRETAGTCAPPKYA